MGTSGSYPGPSNKDPLVPDWLDSEEPGLLPPRDPGEPPGPLPPDEELPVDHDGRPTDRSPVPLPLTQDGTPTADPIPGQRPQVPPANPTNLPDKRFGSARSNFSRFARSGGANPSSLKRALHSYVATASGGPKTAARRMGASRQSTSKLLSFLSNAVSNSSAEALRALNLEALAGRPIDEVFLALADYICPDGGTVDQGIAREAYFETIADLAATGIATLDALTSDQMQTILELSIAHSIEARIYNDIGAGAIALPSGTNEIAQVEAQLFDFIRASVSDALTESRDRIAGLTKDTVNGVTSDVYERAFAILQDFNPRETV